MAHSVTFYKFNKRVNSTARPSGGITTECNFKEQTDYHAPTIRVHNIGYDYNMFSMDGKYYWITAAVTMPNNWVEYTGKIDAMATLADQIKATTAFVERSESGTTALVDGLAPAMTSDTNVVSETTLPVILNESNIANQGTYLVRVVNHSDPLCLNFVQIGNLHRALDSDELIEALKNALFGLNDTILSVMYIPISTENYTRGSTELKIAGLSLGNFPTAIPKVMTGTLTLSNGLNLSSGASLGSSAYRRLSAHLPFAGNVTLSADDFRDGNINVKYAIDLLSGTIAYNVCNGARIIASAGGSFAQTVPFGSTSVNVGNIASSAMGIGTVIGGIVTGNLAAAAAGALSSVGNGAFASSGGVGGVSGSSADTAYLNVQIIEYNRTPPEALANKASVVGLPMYRTVQLGTLSGFVKCISASVQAAEEYSVLEEANRYLNTGAFIV